MISTFVAGCAAPHPHAAPSARLASSTPRPRIVARACHPQYELGFIDRVAVPTCADTYNAFSYETLDFAHPAIGTIGPYSRRIVAVLHSGGGSGGAFFVAIFMRIEGQLHFVADIQLDGHLQSVAIRGDRLYVRGGHLLGGDADCCPSATATYVIESRRDGFVLEHQWWR